MDTWRAPDGGVGHASTASAVVSPRRRSNELFCAFESYHSPRVRELRRRYGLDEVVAGIDGEWDRILALRAWIRSQIGIEDDHPTPARADAFAILDAARLGGRFHCAHFSIVQHAVLNSFGFVARRMQAGSGEKDGGRNHGVNEVWVNEFAKWAVVDAKYDLHFEKDGVPLSALEIRDEVWRDGGASVVPVTGPGRTPLVRDGAGTCERRVSTYRWCAWETDTNRFTAFPAAGTSALIVLADETFRAHTWYRDGRPHWAYGTPYFIETTRRDWIEWTPNVISSSVTVRGGEREIALESFTPNFATYQRRAPDGAWTECADRVCVALADERAEFEFRAVNLFGVTGPVHRAVVAPSGAE